MPLPISKGAARRRFSGSPQIPKMGKMMGLWWEIHGFFYGKSMKIRNGMDDFYGKNHDILEHTSLIEEIL